MSHDMGAVEAVRARFRPELIRNTRLFVGESEPASCDFFDHGNTALQRHMQRAIEEALGEGGEVFRRFKAFGWCPDDLVLTPVNQLAKPKTQNDGEVGDKPP